MTFPDKLIPRPAFWARAAKEKKNHPSYAVEVLIFVLVFYIANLVQGLVLGIPEAIWLYHAKGAELEAIIQDYITAGSLDWNALQALTAQQPDWFLLAELFSFAVMILAAVLYCRLIEKRSLASMGLMRKHPAAEYLCGLGIGFLLFSAVYWLGFALGGWKLGQISVTRSQIGMILLFFTAYMIQGAAEELMIRGYLATSLASSMPAPFAVLLSSIIFGMVHTGNPGFTLLSFCNIVLVGVFFCVYMLKRNNIWGACAIHSMWNFAQGCIYGLSVSGLDKSATVYTSEVTGYNELLTGGQFGPEGSLCTTVVLLAAIGVLLAVKGKSSVPDIQPLGRAQSDDKPDGGSGN